MPGILAISSASARSFYLGQQVGKCAVEPLEVVLTILQRKGMGKALDIEIKQSVIGANYVFSQQYGDIVVGLDYVPRTIT